MIVEVYVSRVHTFRRGEPAGSREHCSFRPIHATSLGHRGVRDVCLTKGDPSLAVEIPDGAWEGYSDAPYYCWPRGKGHARYTAPTLRRAALAGRFPCALFDESALPTRTAPGPPPPTEGRH